MFDFEGEAMRIFLKAAVGAGLLAGLAGCGGKELSTMESFQAAAQLVTKEHLQECVDRLKAYRFKGLFHTDRYEMTGPLRPNPGFTCMAGFARGMGYKIASYTAPVKQVTEGGVWGKSKPSNKDFLLCQYTIMENKIEMTRWHVGPMAAMPHEAAACGLRTQR